MPFNSFDDIFFFSRHRAKDMVRVLLHNYVAQEPSPLDLTSDHSGWFCEYIVI